MQRLTVWTSLVQCRVSFLLLAPRHLTSSGRLDTEPNGASRLCVSGNGGRYLDRHSPSTLCLVVLAYDDGSCGV